jgi:protein-S-isoprenylcysteine O-methyltransferase Ste14
MTRFDRFFVWAGGAIFVFSLAACAYVYIFVWATPAPMGGGWSAVAVDTALFGVFALHHSLLAREAVKRQIACLVRLSLIRSFYVWTASLLLIGVLALWRPVTGDVYHLLGWLAVAPAAIQLAGVGLIARSVATIDPLELAGIAPISGKDTLQVTGPYHWVRHPIYLGWVLALFGAAHMTADRLAFAVISTGYVCIAIPWEERSLLRAFGEPYARYRRQVRWRVLPYVY